MTDTSIQLDAMHRVFRHGDRWLLQRMTPDGWRRLSLWDGPRKSLFNRMEQYGIVPSRAAEAALGAISERTGFVDHSAEEQRHG